MLPLNIMRISGLLLHAKHCNGVIVRFSTILVSLIKMLDTNNCHRF